MEALADGTMVEYPLPPLPVLSGGRSAVVYGGLALTDAKMCTSPPGTFQRVRTPPRSG